MNENPAIATACRRRIFIVDDHPLVREGLTNLINGQSDLIVCGQAEDSAGAIAGIAKARPDVALIDISLKNESGLELIKNLESQFPLVALIVLSMHDEALYAERALRAARIAARCPAPVRPCSRRTRGPAQDRRGRRARRSRDRAPPGRGVSSKG